LELRRRRLAGAAVLLLAVGLAGSAAAARPTAAKSPRVKRVRCVAGCAGIRRAAPRSEIRWTGHHLAAIDEVSFPGAEHRISTTPLAAGRRSVKARVPRGATSGRPLLLAPSGPAVQAAEKLTIVRARKLPGRHEFKLLRESAPARAFFDGGKVRLAYRFRARTRSDVKLKIVRSSNGAVVDHLIERDQTPYSSHAAGWDGLRSNGGAAPAGGYELRIGPPGRHGEDAAHFVLLDAEFPVRGPHGYGGSLQRFGAPRTGGRVHQGQDVFAACGTREVAARGGRVQAEGYDPQLYGNWLVIDGHATGTDYRYAHMLSPTPLHTGERVLTGETVGHVGKTGNAEHVGCMLHFEEWPSGWEHGHPIDPLPDLRRWDSWS
jgi:murein DD-endopeptidase MepM/ murein hydrolase activator NlpD